MLSSLVTENKLGLANCRFAATRVGRAAFEVGYRELTKGGDDPVGVVGGGDERNELNTSAIAEAAKRSFQNCHASFCDGGCAQGVLVGALVATSSESQNTKRVADFFGLCLNTNGLGFDDSSEDGDEDEDEDPTKTDEATDQSGHTTAFTPTPVTCAAGVGQGLFAVAKSVESAVGGCGEFSKLVAGARKGNDANVDANAVEARLTRACVGGVLLRNALSLVTKLTLEVGEGVDVKNHADTSDTVTGVLKSGLNKACEAFVEPPSVGADTETSVLDKTPPTRNPALCGASLGRAMAMLTAPWFVHEDAEAAGGVDDRGGVAERLCAEVEHEDTQRACASAARAAVAAREVSDGFRFCQAREREVEDGFGEAIGGDDYDAVSDDTVTVSNTTVRNAAVINGTNETSTYGVVTAATGDDETTARPASAFVETFETKREGSETGFDFGFPGCALAMENDSAFSVAVANGGAPEVASLPFCGKMVDYPVAAGKRVAHRREDDGIKVLFEHFAALLGGDAKFDTDQTTKCAAEMKREMCRTAFAVCAGGTGHELEYCAHAHVPSFGAGVTTVGICTGAGESGIGGVSEGVGQDSDASAKIKLTEIDLGNRIACGAMWNGAACFRLPEACASMTDTGVGSCPTRANAWQGMRDGCFYAKQETEASTNTNDATAPVTVSYFSKSKKNAPDSALATPASLVRSKSDCAGVDPRGSSPDNSSTDLPMDSSDDEERASSQPQRNASETAKGTFQIVKEHASEVFSKETALEKQSDPRRSASFTRSDAETGGALWILCAQGLVLLSLLAAAWTCTKPCFGDGDGVSGGGKRFWRWGSRKAPGGGGPFFSRLKSYEKESFKHSVDDQCAELGELPTAAKGGTLATIPKRGKSSPEKTRGARRTAEAPF